MVTVMSTVIMMVVVIHTGDGDNDGGDDTHWYGDNDGGDDKHWRR